MTLCRSCGRFGVLPEDIEAMPLTIPDSVLEQAGLSEDQARMEIACRLFEMRRLSLWRAAQWAVLEQLFLMDEAAGLPAAGQKAWLFVDEIVVNPAAQ